MKVIKNLFVVLIVCSLILLSCQEQKKDNTNDIPEETQQKLIDAPKQIISLEEADSLYVNYQRRRATNIIKMEAQQQEEGTPFIPTEFVSFDIDVLKTYIKYVEQEAKNGGTKTDSLRIYLGNYGKIGKKYPRKNTVFIVPTAAVNGDYGGIYIGANGKAKLISDWIKGQQMDGQNGEKKSKAAILPSLSPSTSLQEGTSLVLNWGQSGPPPRTDF